MRKLLFLAAILYAVNAQASYSPDAVKTTLGTVARNLSDHFADVYNAADWGVTCDGIALATEISITLARLFPARCIISPRLTLAPLPS